MDSVGWALPTLLIDSVSKPALRNSANDTFQLLSQRSFHGLEDLTLVY